MNAERKNAGFRPYLNSEYTSEAEKVQLEPLSGRTYSSLQHSSYWFEVLTNGINLTPEFTCILEHSGKMSGASIVIHFFHSPFYTLNSLV
jgi:hypothetical protein